jgi:hypothetical protein
MRAEAGILSGNEVVKVTAEKLRRERMFPQSAVRGNEDEVWEDKQKACIL